jgi:hypothetical protein
MKVHKNRVELYQSILSALPVYLVSARDFIHSTSAPHVRSTPNRSNSQTPLTDVEYFFVLCVSRI